MYEEKVESLAAGTNMSYLENQPEHSLSGGIPIMVEGKGENYVPSADYFHLDQVTNGPSVSQADFDMLKHQYVSSLDYSKELESKNKELTTHLNELENKAGAGTYHLDFL